ncbi:LysM peptidoglycan-binding domain-containing protein [Saccharopolyspora cebuensis]|uniref:LysM peptidoglycan-binding domain-containing protein n=1 Tax=Saccharopolyspora cebuensis TaxID=418759 RepID=A0ABV4CKL7_9PSEU
MLVGLFGRPIAPGADGVAVGSTAAPGGTDVVEVRPGEDLRSLAVRVAPGADPVLLAERIADLNGLDGERVAVGSVLVVPTGRE